MLILKPHKPILWKELSDLLLENLFRRLFFALFERFIMAAVARDRLKRRKRPAVNHNSLDTPSTQTTPLRFLSVAQNLAISLANKGQRSLPGGCERNVLLIYFIFSLFFFKACLRSFYCWIRNLITGKLSPPFASWNFPVSFYFSIFTFRVLKLSRQIWGHVSVHIKDMT